MAIILLILCVVAALAGTTGPAEVNPSKRIQTPAQARSPARPVTVTPESTCDPARAIVRDLSIPSSGQSENPSVHICDDK